MKVVLEFVHKYNPRFDDVVGPFDISLADYSSPKALRRWFKKHKIILGRGEFERRGNKGIIVFFPSSKMASSPHSITIRPGTRTRLKGRELREMTRRIKDKGYSKPGLYARKLWREGVRLKSRWTEEGTAEGHLQEGGRSRTGRRYVPGVEERLWAPRGESGSLEQTHGFRDPHRTRRNPRHEHVYEGVRYYSFKITYRTSDGKKHTKKLMAPGTPWIGETVDRFLDGVDVKRGSDVIVSDWKGPR